MPLYEYKAENADNACNYCRNSFEMMQPINGKDLKTCPKCNKKVIKLISLPLGFLDKNKQANQYPEVKYAKYWRDRDGNRHRVTQADGHAKSPTVSSHRKRSDEQVESIKKEAAQKRKQIRQDASYRRFVQSQKKKI